MDKIMLSLVLVILNSCTNLNGSHTPEVFQTNYNKYKSEVFKLKFGDLIRIKGTTINGVVGDITKDEGGIWYGIIFLTSENKLFGRNIPNGLSGECLKLLDFSYLNEAAINTLEVLGNLNLNYDHIGVGANSSVVNKEELLKNYHDGIEKRKSKETPCVQKITTLEPVNENYRNLSEITR